MEGEADRGEAWCLLLVLWEMHPYLDQPLAAERGSRTTQRSFQPPFSATCQQWTLKMLMDLNLANQGRLRELILISGHEQEKRK